MFKDEDEAARRKRIAALRGEGRAATPSPQVATPPALPAQAPVAPLSSPRNFVLDRIRK